MIHLKNKTTLWVVGVVALLLLVVIALPSLRGPSQKQILRKPVSLAPEVKKYTKEPTISVYRHKNGEVQNLALEKYLEGVVAAEIGSNQPREALRAQAITARSLTMAKILYTGGTKDLHKTDACDLPEHFQAYDESQVTDAIRAAVKDTRGQVVLYQGKFAYALFHSYAGPKTADINEYFPDLADIAGAYIKPVASGGAKYVPADEKSWKASIPKGEVQNNFPGATTVDDIKITKKGPSGRAVDITAGGKTIKAYNLRTALGPERMKSTLISKISVQGDKVVIEGVGWGHGCGLSQWGAYEMAKDGKTAQQIVTYYYPGTQLTDLWK